VRGPGARYSRLEPSPGSGFVQAFDLADEDRGGLPPETTDASSSTPTAGGSSPTASSTSAASTSPATPTAPAADARLRATLNAHAEDVLACTSTPRALVRVEWSVGAITTIALGGELAGSEAEGCVRALLSSHLEAPSDAGSVLHLVRRE
jgi:hypothetical protein